MAQVPSNMTKAVHHSQGYLAMRSGLKEIFVHKFNQHFSKLAFNKAQGGLLILKTASTKTVKRRYRNALESLSLRQQRAVYWIDSLLLFWTVTLEKPSFLICGTGERATGSHPLGSGGWVGVKRGK